MNTSPSLFSLIARAGLGAIIRIILYPLFWGILLLIAGIYTYRLGPGAVPDLHWAWDIPAMILIAPLYALAGITGGAILAVANTLYRQIDVVEGFLQGIIDPVMAEVLGRIPFGSQGMPRDAFRQSVDDKIEQVGREAESGQRGWIRGSLYRTTLRGFRFVVLGDFMESLEQQGEERVTATNVERFTRQKIVTFIKEAYQEQIDLIRYLIWGLWLVLLAIPVYLGW